MASFQRRSSPWKTLLRWPNLLTIFALFLIYKIFLLLTGSAPDVNLAQHTSTLPRKALVVASVSSDNTTWLDDFSDWERNIYVVDDKNAALTVARNKGREANVYLTYIIDNYHKLPDYMLFLHALRYQWHNEDPMYDGVPVIQNLRLPHIDEVGYVNTRCTWVLGCPNELQDIHNAHRDGPEQSAARTEKAYAAAFKQLFPESDVPDRVGVPCGAQFALSRAKVLERPRADYTRYRQWLWDTKIDDSVSGRILEYSWHIMFGKPALYCLDPARCFCNKYGLCNLTCSHDSCLKRFQLPRYATIPDGWPDSGKEGQEGWPAKDWYL